MAETKPTLGQAIDQIINALDSLDPDARQTAIEAACSHLGVKLPSGSTPQPPIPLSPPPSTLAQTLHGTQAQQPTQIDIKTLKEQKKPTSAAQMACLVAYYLQELAPDNERKDNVTAVDIEKYFKQAKFRLPKTIPQLLPDSRLAGYFDSAPGKGEYRLNPVGYNLVVHNLPKSKEK